MQKKRFQLANEPVEAIFSLLITHIIGFQFWKQNECYRPTHNAPYLSVSNILFNPCGVFPFVLGRYHRRGTYKL